VTRGWDDVEEAVLKDGRQGFIQMDGNVFISIEVGNENRENSLSCIDFWTSRDSYISGWF